MECHECDHGLECCHGLSIRHPDGTTECLGDDPCDLRHELHRWFAGCDEAGCRCGLQAFEIADALSLAA